MKEFLAGHGMSWAASNAGEVLKIADWNREYALKKAVLGMYGGMGSLSDIRICRANGDDVQDEAVANAELGRLTQTFWSGAQRL